MFNRTYYRVNTPAKVSKPVVRDVTQRPLVVKLASLKAKMSQSTIEIAASLITAYNKYGKLTDKQYALVERIIAQLEAPAAPVETVTIVAASIFKMFEAAKQKLRRAKITLRDSTNQNVVFKLAGPASKYAGQVIVSDGGPYGAAKLFGRIDTSGNFFPTRTATDAVKNLVIEFAADPENVAAKYGHLTGACCFCSHGLKDERSTAVGYGPVCATRFGLRWGR